MSRARPAARCASASTCPRRGRAARRSRCSTTSPGSPAPRRTSSIKAGAQRVAAELGARAGHPRHQPARSALPGRRRRLGLRHRRRLLRRRHPGALVARTTAWTRTSTQELPALVEAQLPGRPTRAASSATRWAATARWRWRCATPAATAASRRSRRSARRSRCPGARRRSPATSATTARPGGVRRLRAGRARAAAAAAPGRPGDRRQVPGRAAQAGAARGGLRRRGPARCGCGCHAGYDHSYYFIATFVDDHLAHHARALAP